MSCGRDTGYPFLLANVLIELFLLADSEAERDFYSPAFDICTIYSISYSLVICCNSDYG